MNVYDQAKQSSKLLRSKKVPKSSEETSKPIDKEQSRLDSIKRLDAAGKEQIEMPIKISSLNAAKKEESVPKRMELKATNIDYAQTDENETLQDISTSFSEEKFDSLPEQMNSEAIRKQFHEAFKSMSIVNEEVSDQDSSLNEDKKTEIEKVQTAANVKTAFQNVNQISKTDDAFSKTNQPNEKDKITIKTSIQQVNQINKTVDAFKPEKGDEKETKNGKVTVKASIQKVNQISSTINAFKQNDLDAAKKDESKNLVNAQEVIKDNQIEEAKLFEENSSEVFKEYGKIIITNVHRLTTNYTKKEENDMINKGWIVVDSIKEIDEKEDELKKEETKLITTTDLTNQDSKESVKKQDSKNDLKEKIIKIEKDQVKKEEATIKRIENKSLEKIKSKSEDNSDRSKKSKKSSLSSTSSASSSNLEKESKIPKLNNKNLAKLTLTSSSTTSSPSKKSNSSKSSTSTTSKSSPIKKSKTFVLQTTVEEKQSDNLINDLLSDRKAKTTTTIKIDEIDKLDKQILFDEDKINIDKIANVTIAKQEASIEKLMSSNEKTLKVEDNNQTNEKVVARKLSIVSFPEMNSLDVEKDSLNRKKYARTPIKQLSIEEKLHDEELSAPNDDKCEDEDSSPQSLNEDLNKEQVRKEKNDLIENIEKKLREESIKQIKQIEEIAVRKLIDEEQKIIHQKESLESEIKKNEQIESKDVKRIESKKLEEHQKTLSKEDKLAKKDSKVSIGEEENKKDENTAKVDSKSEIIYKKSSIETEDVSERTAYIENMLRTSGYTERIIEKANEFINGKDTNKEEGIVEEVCVKLVKKNSKDYYSAKDKQTDQTGGEKTSSKTNGNEKKEETKSEQTKKQTTSQQSIQQSSTTNQQSSNQAKSIEKSASQLKKSKSLSRIPTIQTPKSKRVEINSNLDRSAFKRNCLKASQTKSEPLEQAMNRPIFKRKKNDLPPKHSIQLDSEQIKKKWNDIKTTEKDKLHKKAFYSHLRRTTSNPVISNSFDLIYEINSSSMPKWAKDSVNQNSQQSKNPKRSNTTSIITQTKRILEKIEKKEIEEITTRTIVNDEEKFTKTSREESKTHRSETEEIESSISGKQCGICKKIIIPITEDMKTFCKRDLRKMLSDSALEVKTCRC